MEKPHHVGYSLRGSEPTALEAVDCEWRYALLVMQARNDDDDDDDENHACCENFVKFYITP